MPAASLIIFSKNYSSWSLRGWLLCKMADLDFEEKMLDIDSPSDRAELSRLSPSMLLPCLEHDGARVWDTLSIAEYLAELNPKAGLLPKDRIPRAHCRSVSSEMHSGFYNLRTGLPMNIKAHYPKFKIWAGAMPEIARVLAIWKDCLSTYGGPYLFGELSMADAMYAPVCSRFLTYDVQMDQECAAYCETIMAWPDVAEWVGAAKDEPDEPEDVDAEF
jgi:glutathione S-transferase